MSSWSNWQQDSDNPKTAICIKIEGQWIHWRTAHIDDPNPDENNFHSKHIYNQGRESYPEEDCIFCDLKIDGYNFKSRLSFIKSMRQIVKDKIPYTLGMRFKDASRWLDISLLKRCRRQARLSKLDEKEEYDLFFLHKENFVRARATGQSITEIFAEVENLFRKKIHVVIKPGTYFVAKGNHQNMVTRREYRFDLYPLDTEDIGVDAACINADLPIPDETGRFYGVKKVSSDLARFLEASTNEEDMTVQAGVWALTDNYSGYDVKEHLVTRDQYGNTSKAVSDYNIEKARRILNELGIRHNL